MRGAEWSASGSGHLNPDRKLGGSQCLSCCFGRKTNLLQFLAIKPRFLGYPPPKLRIIEPTLSLCETINTYSYFEMPCKEIKKNMLLFWLLMQTSGNMYWFSPLADKIRIPQAFLHKISR